MTSPRSACRRATSAPPRRSGSRSASWPPTRRDAPYAHLPLTSDHLDICFHRPRLSSVRCWCSATRTWPHASSGCASRASSCDGLPPLGAERPPRKPRRNRAPAAPGDGLTRAAVRCPPRNAVPAPRAAGGAQSRARGQAVSRIIRPSAAEHEAASRKDPHAPQPSCAALLLLLLSAPAFADEGMWTFHDFPQRSRQAGHTESTSAAPGSTRCAWRPSACPTARPPSSRPTD